jgi:hypothetical protein
LTPSRSFMTWRWFPEEARPPSRPGSRAPLQQESMARLRWTASRQHEGRWRFQRIKLVRCSEVAVRPAASLLLEFSGRSARGSQQQEPSVSLRPVRNQLLLLSRSRRRTGMRSRRRGGWWVCVCVCLGDRRGWDRTEACGRSPPIRLADRFVAYPSEPPALGPHLGLFIGLRSAVRSRGRERRVESGPSTLLIPPSSGIHVQYSPNTCRRVSNATLRKAVVAPARGLMAVGGICLMQTGP